MGFENITANNGFGIAATGMTIVFFALSAIALFINFLPRILDQLSFLLPPEEAAAPKPPSGPAVDDALLVAIAFAARQRELDQRNPPEP